MSIIGYLRRCGIILLLSALGGTSLPAVAQGVPTAQALRAAMVFNFLKFTEFPAEGGANAQRLRVCIAIGDPRQADALAELAGRKVWSREVSVVRFSGRDDDCQVLYVDLRQRWNAVEEQRGRALTIGAYAGFTRDGGMIEIALQENGARFDINLAEGRRAGFRFSPQLLRLARHVHD